MCQCYKIYRKVKFWSIQLQPGRKRGRFSSIHISPVLDNPQSNLDPMLIKLIFQWFLHEDLSPSLYIGIITDSHQSLKISFLSQNGPKSFINYYFNILPLASLYLLRKLISLITSISDERLVSTCVGSLAGITGRPIADVDQLNCALKFSVQCASKRS